mgnify:FL=1
MKFRVVVLAIATISLSFSQVAINAEATTVSANPILTSTQTKRLIHRGVLGFPN